MDPSDGACGAHPNDVCSAAAPLLGVAARLLAFDGGADHGAAGGNLVGMGPDASAVARYDVLALPSEAQMPRTPLEVIEWLERQMAPPAARRGTMR